MKNQTRTLNQRVTRDWSKIRLILPLVFYLTLFFLITVLVALGMPGERGI